jgi:hypothetical protein
VKRIVAIAFSCACIASAAACGAGDAGNPGRTAAPVTPGASRTDATAPAIEKTAAAEIDPSTTGGNPGDAPRIISTIPAPPDGATPSIDPDTIAEVEAPDHQLRIVIDMNASEPGIQRERTVKRGDRFKVGVVVFNAPPFSNNIGGISNLEFKIRYDRRVILAPTYEGGPATARNPRLNVEGLATEGATWQCLPAPEGDLEDPIGIFGDGLPETGEAFLSCFTIGRATQSGDKVLGVVEFYAIDEGESDLQLFGVSLGDGLPIIWANCEGDLLEPQVPCDPGSVKVE